MGLNRLGYVMKRLLGLAAALMIVGTQVQAEKPTAAQLCELSGTFITMSMEAIAGGLSEKQAKKAISEALPELGFVESFFMKKVVASVYDMDPATLTEDFAEMSVAGCLAKIP
jgi:hypothetical protein